MSMLSALKTVLGRRARKKRNEAQAMADELVDPSKSPAHRALNAGMVIAVVVIGVVALVGILIFAQVNEALPEPANEDLAESQDAVTSGFGGAMELVPVILIVALATLVIGYVQMMRT